MRAVHLRTEYLKEPLGINVVIPRFYWNCEGGKEQTAYRIVAKLNGKEAWDTGEVESSSMAHIRYRGGELKHEDHVEWSVRLRDENGEWGEESSSWFEYVEPWGEQWQACWIRGKYTPKKNVHYPVDCFRKEFKLRGGIVKARLYAAARGVYDMALNGGRVGDVVLAPGVTDYRKRIQMHCYDVKEMLRENASNCWEIRLGAGWYRGSSAAYGVMNVYGLYTEAVAQLDVFYEDGSRERIVTDGEFSWSNDGPIRFADLRDGEVYDAGMTPSYGGQAVMRARRKDEKMIVFVSNNVPVREHERFRAALRQTGEAKVYDFGQNIAGYLEFTVKGRKGQEFRLICGEVLDQDGHVDLSGIQESRPAAGWSRTNLLRKLLGRKLTGEIDYTPRQEIRFICSGGEDHYKTNFAVFGFRYAELIGENGPEPEDITAIAVYSDLEQTGSFSCSNELVNRLYQNSVWSMKGNFLDIPTDCPTRERLGWTGDAQIFFDTAAYMMNVAPFFHKWAIDMDHAQYDNGLLPAVIPFAGVEMMYKATGSSVGWADASYLLFYRYYNRYQDIRLLECYYYTMKDYTDYLLAHLGMKDRKEAKANPYNEYTYEKGVHLGEWLEPEEFRDRVYGAKAKHPEECTAYLYLAMKTMAEVCAILYENDGREKYMIYRDTCRKMAEGVKKAYRYIFEKEGNFDTFRQAKLVRPLAFGLFDGEDKRRVQEQLIRAVEQYGYRVGTGFLSTPFLLPALTEAGRPDIAYRVLENTKKPGWLAEVLEGATTIWENWEGNLSQNHYSPGAVCQWLFETVGGIRVEAENHFRLAPIPGGTMTWADVSYLSLYGDVRVSWKKTEDGEFAYDIVIPVNTTAEVALPDGRGWLLGAGNYHVEPHGEPVGTDA